MNMYFRENINSPLVNLPNSGNVNAGGNMMSSYDVITGLKI